jgi:hypothetical protein
MPLLAPVTSATVRSSLLVIGSPLLSSCLLAGLIVFRACERLAQRRGSLSHT